MPCASSHWPPAANAATASAWVVARHADSRSPHRSLLQDKTLGIRGDCGCAKCGVRCAPAVRSPHESVTIPPHIRRDAPHADASRRGRLQQATASRVWQRHKHRSARRDGSEVATALRGQALYGHTGRAVAPRRIDRYNDVYGAIETMLRDDALADAAWLDAASSKGDVRGRESARVPLRPAVDNVGRHERRRPRALHRYGRRVMIVVVCCVIGICMPAIGTSTVILISFDRLPPMNTPPAPMIMVP